MKVTYKQMLEQVRRGEKVMGSALSSPDLSIIDNMALAGYEYLLIGAEHGVLSWNNVFDMIRAAEAVGVATMVKVPSFDDELAINKAIDMGASCIKIPGVNSIEEARRAIELVYYPPIGERSYCPYVRGNDYGVEGPSCIPKLNENLTLSLTLETEGAVEHLEELIAEPHIQTYTVGNFDLSLRLGVPMQTYHPKVQEVVHEVARLCEKYDKTFCVQVRNGEDVKQFEKYKGIYYYAEMPIHTLYVALREKRRDFFGD